MFIGIFLLLCSIVIFFERYIFSLIYGKVINNKTRIILVCSHETYLLFIKYLRKTHIRYHIIGIIQVDNKVIPQEELYLGKLETHSFENVLKNQVVDQVVFAMPKDIKRRLSNM